MAVCFFTACIERTGRRSAQTWWCHALHITCSALAEANWPCHLCATGRGGAAPCQVQVPWPPEDRRQQELVRGAAQPSCCSTRARIQQQARDAAHSCHCGVILRPIHVYVPVPHLTRHSLACLQGFHTLCPRRLQAVEEGGPPAQHGRARTGVWSPAIPPAACNKFAAPVPRPKQRQHVSLLHQLCHSNRRRSSSCSSRRCRSSSSRSSNALLGCAWRVSKNTCSFPALPAAAVSCVRQRAATTSAGALACLLLTLAVLLLHCDAAAAGLPWPPG